MTMPSKIFVISGPSGAGKTTILKKLFQRKFVKNNFLKSISYTTRQKRRGEQKDKDYFFVTRETFWRLKKKKFFLETQRVVDDFYGTPRSIYRRAIRERKGLVLCVDVKGGKYLKSVFKKDKIVTIFVAPPSERALSQRMEKRGELRGVIQERIQLAKKELQYLKYYGYLIVNRNVDESIDDLEAILRAEQLRRGK